MKKRIILMVASAILLSFAMLAVSVSAFLGADSVSCGSEINMIIKGAKEIADSNYL